VLFYDAAFSKKSTPDNIPEFILEREKATIADIIVQLIDMSFVKSKSEFIRLVNQGGIQLNGEKLAIGDLDRVIICDDVMKIGKKHFIRFIK